MQFKSKPTACGFLCALAALLALPASGQSLDSHAPAPLQPGDNTGTVDNFVGSNYFYLTGGPGTVVIKVSYNSMSLLGNAQKSALNIELTDDKKPGPRNAPSLRRLNPAQPPSPAT
jgi:hypothetical protein